VRSFGSAFAAKILAKIIRMFRLVHCSEEPTIHERECSHRELDQEIVPLTLANLGKLPAKRTADSLNVVTRGSGILDVGKGISNPVTVSWRSAPIERSSMSRNE